MKKIIPEYRFTDEQLNTISSLARALKLTESTVKILYARGIDTKEKIGKFLSPSKKNFLSPYRMSGMKEAVELIAQARDEGWRVAVFGDYDADGICASAIMDKALREFGIEPYVYVPERSEGYGLSFSAIDKILDDFFPELFITVDCGISNAEQVRYLQEAGVTVVVSDHHELPDVLPDCICINPKFDDDYPYDNLCGAGVAFKIAVALIGERAYEYLDFAALATVADSVPLLGENRDIVAEGLNLIRTNPKTCFSCLLGKNDNEITAQTLAFTVAPRINAAGRMGDANAALGLFLAEKQSEIFSLAVKLNEYNVERQKRCDLLYESAKEKLKEKGAYGNVIMLYDENWSAGFVGIVAARLAEEYFRPAILFVKNGDSMKGSARSIDCVNIFDALKNCSEYISEFGGHSQAAGVNISEENFPLLEEALNRYIAKTYTPEDFIPKIFVAEEIRKEISVKFARELAMLEPYGVGHKKPLFAIRAASCEAKEIKPESPHLAIRSDYIDLMYFGGAKNLKLIESDVEKVIVFECNVSHFRGREYIKGFVRDVEYDAMSGNVSSAIFANCMNRLSAAEPRFELVPIGSEETVRLIRERIDACAYGLCLIASSRRVLANYEGLGVNNIDIFKPSSRNVSNTIVVSPSPDADLAPYDCVVFLDEPCDYSIGSLVGKKVYVNKEICGYRNMLRRLDTDRASLLDVFASLRKMAGKLAGANVLETALSSGALGYDPYEFIFALSVFEELGLVSFAGGKPEIYRGIKTDLNDSLIYTRIRALQKKKEDKK